MKSLAGGRGPPLLVLHGDHGHAPGIHCCNEALHSPCLISPTEACPGEPGLPPHHHHHHHHHHMPSGFTPRSSIHSECPLAPPLEPALSSTFPRVHCAPAYYEGPDDCSSALCPVPPPSAPPVISTGSGSGGRAGQQYPPVLLDHFDRQLPPLHRDGFLTLQYQRTTTTTTTTDNRSDSPGKIRHLVHSVQKLFTKSHSLEGSAAKGKAAGPLAITSGGVGNSSGGGNSGGGGSVGVAGGFGGMGLMGAGPGMGRPPLPPPYEDLHYGRAPRRSKSRERRPRAPGPGWWSSDDNLDSESICHGPVPPPPPPPIVALPAGPHYPELPPVPPGLRYHLETSHSLPEQPLKVSKSNEDVKCPTCMGLHAGSFLKHSSWSSLMVSQGRDTSARQPTSFRGPPDRPRDRGGSIMRRPSPIAELGWKPGPRAPPELPWNVPELTRKMSEKTHFLQVPKEEWVGGHEDDIPCRRMRSGSYIKAMGDEESGGDSDGQLEISPLGVSLQGASRRESYLKATGQRTMSEQHSDRYRSRNESYLRAVSTVSQASCVSQFETVCESVFSEVEAQAMEALDLPGCFRSRSHSYLRAIQAGYAQDDTVSIRSASPPGTLLPGPARHGQPGSQRAGALESGGKRRCMERTHRVTTITTYKKGPPPIPPRAKKPLIAITTQSSTESAQDAYLTAPGSGQVAHSGPSRRESAALSRPAARPRVAPATSGRAEKGRILASVSAARARTVGTGSGGAPKPVVQPSTPPVVPPPRIDWSQSSDSLDSAKALSVAMEAAAAQTHGPAERRRSSASDKAPPPTKAPAPTPVSAPATVPATPIPTPTTPAPEVQPPAHRLSIGIQVDGPGAPSEPDKEKEKKVLSRFHSIGIQVEERRLGRFGRSNSVSASVQADLDHNGVYGGLGLGSVVGSRFTEGAVVRGYGRPLRRRSSETDAMSRHSRRAEIRRQDNVQSDDSPPDYEPWRLRYPGAWMGHHPALYAPMRPPVLSSHRGMPIHGDLRGLGDPRGVAEAWVMAPPEMPLVRPASGRRDGTWFLKLLQAERERMEGWCRQMEQEGENGDLVEETLGKIRSAVGSARLLMSQKFLQFQNLCLENLSPTAEPHPTGQDLAGFWDLLQLAIEDVSLKFAELQQLQQIGWRESDLSFPTPEEPLLPPPLPRKPSRGRGPGLQRQRSAEAADRQRVEARKRLLAAKRAASMRQNSATESADSIEIYIPEAQTRL
uniref:Discs, large (Drosophila) homolog-associated protein 1b n=1 Tax=Eptatretus burgeri TaxID=7764 RepID=A0A8C4Q470_EPTBU